MSDLAIWSLLTQIGQSVLNVLPNVLALAVIFTVVGWFATPCNPGLPWWRKPGLVTDFLFTFLLPLMTGYVRVAMLIVGAMLFYRVQGSELDQFFEQGHGPFAGLPLGPQIAIYLILSDVIMYGTHRAFHTMSLWRYHAIHHAPEHLDWTSANRFHPINILLHSMLADTAMLLAGISPNVLVVLAPLQVGMSALVHANLDWTFGPFRYVIASPVFHRWHHTDYRRGGSKNFAATFPVLDLIFGTFYMPKGELPDAYGVHDKHFPEAFIQQMIYPFVKRTKASRPSTSGQPVSS